MEYFDSSYFSYKDNTLCCENVPVNDIIKAAGTPAYIYSRNFFRDRYNEFSEAFSEIDHIIFFAAKSNFNLSVIKTFADLGSGVDVNSGGELYRALKAGVNPQKILLTGVGKTDEEIRMGLEYNVLLLKAESLDEVIQVDTIARDMRKTAHVAIRVNPDVDAKTHPHISTGLSQNKFGVNPADAIEIFSSFARFKNVVFTGIDMHIGSQVTAAEPFVEAVQKLSEVYFKVKEKGIDLRHFDVGGGVGVNYNNNSEFGISELALLLLPELKKLNCQVFFEPGRYLTANGGALAVKVLNTKNNGSKNFIIVDGAMTDLLRPAFYGAYHHIQPVNISGRNDITADIVGPVCESSDFLAKDREISAASAGDYLTVMSAGAYSMVMSSNYNARRRAAEVLVDGDRFFIVRERESFEDLVKNEKLI